MLVHRGPLVHRDGAFRRWWAISLARRWAGSEETVTSKLQSYRCRLDSRTAVAEPSVTSATVGADV